MNKKNILVPIDESERAVHSIEFIKSFFPKESVTITLMNVQIILSVNGFEYENEIYNATKRSQRILENAKFLLKDYDVKTYFTVGYASKEILAKAKEDNSDIIVMAKSNKKGLTRIIGSVTSGVIQGAESIVMVVP